jgi:ribosomal protein S18 acetylase RimI-like enzyme
MEFESVAGNLRESFRVVAAHRASGELRELEGVSIASAGVAFQMFNAAFLSGRVSTEAQMERRLALASVHFAARGMRWAYWICEDWLEGRTRQRFRQIFRKHNLFQAAQLPGMYAEEIRPSPRELPNLHVRRVDSEPTKGAFCAIGSICFNVPLVWFREVFDSDGIWSDFAAYVGYIDGEPVSTAATVTGEGVIGVYNVATTPGQQRRGYGEAIMRHAIEQARLKHGVTRTILQSTPAGLELYQRMGYRIVTNVAVFCS